MIASGEDAVVARAAFVPSAGGSSRQRRADAAARSDGTAIGARQIVVALVVALTALTVARYLGPVSFGILAGGTAPFLLGMGLGAAGFGVLVVRELATRPQDESEVIAVGVRAQAAWCVGLATVLVAIGLAEGAGRGPVTLVLAPALAFAGVGVAWQLVAVQSRSTRLLRTDLAAMTLQSVIAVVLAVRHSSPFALAANLCIWSCLAAVPARIAVRRQARSVAIWNRAPIGFTRIAVPLGLASVIPVVLLPLDLALLAWLVSPRALAQFGVALEITFFAVAVPGAILAARARTLIGFGTRSDELVRSLAALLRVLLLVAVPLALAISLLARPLVNGLLGTAYLGAVPLVRVLMLGAVLSVAATIAGILAVALGLVRHQLIAGGCGLIVCVAGVLALGPAHGAHAAAWVAVASEGTVVIAALVLLRREFDARDLAAELLYPGPPPGPERRLGASALVAATAIVRSIPALQADPASATAAAAMALGGQASMRPQIGEGRRPAIDPGRGEAIALTVATLAAIALIALAAADVRSSPPRITSARRADVRHLSLPRPAHGSDALSLRALRLPLAPVISRGRPTARKSSGPAGSRPNAGRTSSEAAATVRHAAPTVRSQSPVVTPAAPITRTPAPTVRAPASTAATAPPTAESPHPRADTQPSRAATQPPPTTVVVSAGGTSRSVGARTVVDVPAG